MSEVRKTYTWRSLITLLAANIGAGASHFILYGGLDIISSALISGISVVSLTVEKCSPLESL